MLTEYRKMSIEVLTIELEGVSGSQASSSEAAGELTRCDDVRMS